MKLDDILPGPTFKAKVAIPRPGASPCTVGFEFKHRDASDLREWIAAAVKRPDDELVFEAAAGWDLTDPFNAGTVKQLCEACPGAGAAIVGAYVLEMSGSKRAA